MSVKNLTWVFEHSPYTLGARLVHLALADEANDTYGSLLWLNQETIAQKAGVSRATVNSTLQKMVADGWLSEATDEEVSAIRHLMGRSRAKVYRFLTCQISDTSEEGRCQDAGQVGVKSTVPGRQTTQVVTQEKTSSSPRRKPDTPLPADFRLTPEMSAWATEHLLATPATEVSVETEQFKDHALAHDRRAKNWTAAWRTWMRKGDQMRRERTAPVVRVRQEWEP